MDSFQITALHQKRQKNCEDFGMHFRFHPRIMPFRFDRQRERQMLTVYPTFSGQLRDLGPYQLLPKHLSMTPQNILGIVISICILDLPDFSEALMEHSWRSASSKGTPQRHGLMSVITQPN
jgi:hypothetical protein